ncbi:MAG: hypothetical protein JWN15_4147 [Firmicutes bacterium]|nr:hypothetical protein [Bacillota bacterium]
MSNWLSPVHPAEGEWRACLDGELPGPRHQYLERHLKNCARCQLRFTEVQRTASHTAARLGALHAMAEVAPAPPMPTDLRPRPEHRFHNKEESRMNPFRFTGRVAAVAAVAALASSMFIPGVRAAASDMITVFRTQDARVVKINPADFKLGSQLNLTGVTAGQLAKLVQIEEVRKADKQEGLSLDALTRHGFQAPTYLPDGYTAGKNGMSSGSGEALVHVDVDAVNELLGLAGSKAQLPAELKGQVIQVTTGPTTVMNYANGDKHLTVARMTTPTLSASGKVDVNKTVQLLTSSLGTELGLPTSLQAQLRSIDLTKTLPLPVMDGKGAEVKVNGQTGAYYTDQQGRGAIVWVAGGQVNVVSGPLAQAELLRIAQSVGN